MAQVLEEEKKEEQGGSGEAPLASAAIPALMGDVSISDIEDQLKYLLNRTVTRNSATQFNTSFYTPRNHTVIEAGDSVSTSIMTLAQVDKKYRDLKTEIRSKNKHWWTFADVVPTWEDKIQAIFRGEVKTRENEDLCNTLLHEGKRCIMGESWGGNPWGDCVDCGWLGNQGLRLFAANNGMFIDADRKSGFDEYKMRYEYHWNKYHYDVGNKESKAPSL